MNSSICGLPAIPSPKPPARQRLRMAIVAWVLPLLLLVSSAAVKADQFGDFWFTSDGTAVTIMAYTGPGGAVVIPGTINGLPVTSIGDYAFSGESSMTSVAIPDSVVSIGDGAFEDCAGLTNVSIPASVTGIGSFAFSGCTALAAIVVDAANPNYSSADGVLFNKALTALIQCLYGKIGTYTIPTSVTSIGSYAFSGCRGLTSVSIPGNVTSIGDSAFSWCTALTSIAVDAANPNYSSSDGVLFNKALTALIQYPPGKIETYIIPTSVTSIGSYAFSGCTGLTGVSIPGNVTSIGNWAFYSCTGLTSVMIPNSVVNIGEGAFEECYGLISVTIPNSATSIGGGAFSGCYGLTSVTIPNSVTSIGGSAFSGCYGLTSVTIGNNVTSIGKSAFSDCTGLTSVIIGNSVTSIGERLFLRCTALSSVTIPDSVVSVGERAFEYCDGLISVMIGNSVTSIGDYAFDGCSALTSVSIPDSVISIGNSTFYGCTSLTSVTIPARVTSIGSLAFYGCTGLTGMTIPASVTSIGFRAFGGCTALTAISVDAANPNYSSQNGVLFNKALTALIKCPAGKSGIYIIPNSVTNIGGDTFTGDDAFFGCAGLTSVTIPNSVTSIGDHAFQGCTGLTSLSIPASVTRIGGFSNSGNSTFSYCTAMTAIAVDAANPNYRSLDGVLFDKALTTLLQCPAGKTGIYTVPAGVIDIGSDAFSGCTGLIRVNIPASITSIRSGAFLWWVSAFYGCTALTTIEVDAGNLAYSSTDGVLFTKTLTTLIRYPQGKTGTYTIPASVTSIGFGAFLHCTALTNVSIPTSIIRLEPDIFAGCTGLTAVSIPASITSIGYDAFSGCTALTTIAVDPANPEYSSLDGVLFDKALALLIQYPAGKAGAYTVPASVTDMENSAFEGCLGLGRVTFLGNAPSMWEGPFDDAATGFTVYFFNEATGFTTPTWMGYPSVNMGAPTPVTSWLVSNEVAYNADLQSDPNKDGVPLAVEYGLGLNPGVFNPNPATSKVESNRFALDFSIPEVIPAGVRIYIEEATTLNDWQVIASRTSGGAWTMADGATASEGAVVSGRLPVTVRSGHLLAESAMRFMRLGVEVSGTTSPNPDADLDGLPDSWETTQFGNSNTNRANDDPNHDGIALALEYVLALDPHSQNPPVIHSTGEAERLGVVFSIPAALPTGTRIYIEESTGLSGWQVIASKTSSGAWTTADGATVSEEVAVSGRIPVTVRSGHARSESSARFMRLGVELPTPTAP